MNRRVLCVDDEPNVLEGLARTLSEDFDVYSATSGAEAIGMMSGEAFAVIISDMRMPEMDGAAFLSKARALSPHSVRVLLTGQTDVHSAIAAVNQGAIFRFLAKPCSPATMVETIRGAVEHHRLLCAERELLDGTLHGIVKLLTDVLAVASPGVFTRATRLRDMVAHATKTLTLEDAWQYEVAALLSQLGCIALPEEMVTRIVSGKVATAAEQTAFHAHPATAARLLAGIPRLADVASMIATHRDAVAPAAAGAVSMGAAMLRAATMLDELRVRGVSREDAMLELRQQPRLYDRRVLEALDGFRAADERRAEQSLLVEQLAVGMICEEDVLSSAGSVLVCMGTKLTSVMLERLRRFAANAGVREPIRVRIMN